MSFLGEQTSAAALQLSFSPTHTQLSTGDYQPQMLDFEGGYPLDPVFSDQGDSQDGQLGRVPDNSYTDMDQMPEEEGLPPQSSPIKIGQMRGYAEVSDVAYSTSPPNGLGLGTSFHEQRGDVTQHGWTPNQPTVGSYQQTVAYSVSPEVLGVQSVSPPTQKRQRSDSKKGKSKPEPEENLSPADRIVFSACLLTSIQCEIDENVCKKGKLEIGFQKPPSKKVRPSYNCEGSRGAIKTDEGGTVELNVKFNETLQGEYTAILIAGCITEETKNQATKSHPHFKTSSVADQIWTEQMMDGGPVVCVKKEIYPNQKQNKIKLEVGIKRIDTGERVSRLIRKCRIFYRLCIMQKVNNTSTEQDWRLIEWAQIVTGSINCEQQQGPPAMTEISRRECAIRGGMDLTCKGKNLESKAEKPNVFVKFSHKSSKWCDYATVHHNVTSPTSLCFEVPPFRALRDDERHLQTIPVTIEVSVDDRVSDGTMEFFYKNDPMQYSTGDNNPTNDPELMNFLMDVQPASLPMAMDEDSQGLNSSYYLQGQNGYNPGAYQQAANFTPVHQQMKSEDLQHSSQWIPQVVKQEPNYNWSHVADASCSNNGTHQLNSSGGMNSQTNWSGSPL